MIIMGIEGVLPKLSLGQDIKSSEVVRTHILQIALNDHNESS